MGSVGTRKNIRLSCGHNLFGRKFLPDGDTVWCYDCKEYVDVTVPSEVATGVTYHPVYDCSTEPVPGKRGKYLAKCVKDGCGWERTANYHDTMEGLHKHQMNSHTRWGNPMLEGF